MRLLIRKWCCIWTILHARAHEGRRQGEVVKDPVTALECAATTKPCKNLNRGLYTSFLDDCGLYTRGRGARLRVGGGGGECCKVYKGVSVNMLLPLLIPTIYFHSTPLNFFSALHLLFFLRFRIKFHRNWCGVNKVVNFKDFSRRLLKLKTFPRLYEPY